jgi:hypothetical protein
MGMLPWQEKGRKGKKREEKRQNHDKEWNTVTFGHLQCTSSLVWSSLLYPQGMQIDVESLLAPEFG